MYRTFILEAKNDEHEIFPICWAGAVRHQKSFPPVPLRTNARRAAARLNICSVTWVEIESGFLKIPEKNPRREKNPCRKKSSEGKNLPKGIFPNNSLSRKRKENCFSELF